MFCPRVFTVSGAALLLSACLGPRLPSVDSEPTPAAQESRATGALVLPGGDLTNYTGLLDALAGRLPMMRVWRSQGCPTVTLRGRSSIVGPSDPRVYVDGQPAADTCILDMLSPRDVERVEVYPSGKTSRPGYFTDPNGLILVFSRRATDG